MGRKAVVVPPARWQVKTVCERGGKSTLQCRRLFEKCLSIDVLDGAKTSQWHPQLLRFSYQVKLVCSLESSCRGRCWDRAWRASLSASVRWLCWMLNWCQWTVFWHTCSHCPGGIEYYKGPNDVVSCVDRLERYKQWKGSNKVDGLALMWPMTYHLKTVNKAIQYSGKLCCV